MNSLNADPTVQLDSAVCNQVGRPDIDAFEGSVMALDRQAALSAANNEMRHAAELLERVDEGELEAYLVELIDRSGGPADRPAARAEP